MAVATMRHIKLEVVLETAAAKALAEQARLGGRRPAEQAALLLETTLAAQPRRATPGLRPPPPPIRELHLSTRVYNALRRGGVEDVDQLTLLCEDDLLIFRDLGPGAIQEIRRALARYLARL